MRLKSLATLRVARGTLARLPRNPCSARASSVPKMASAVIRGTPSAAPLAAAALSQLVSARRNRAGVTSLKSSPGLARKPAAYNVKVAGISSSAKFASATAMSSSCASKPRSCR